MANYDNKLGEWFKQVEQQEQELKAKKTPGGPEASQEPEPTVDQTPRAPRISRMEIEGPAREAPASVVATVETVGVVADTTLAGQPASSEDGEQTPDEREESAARLFGDEAAPAVEDFFSFLNRTAEQPVVEEVEDRVFELPRDQPAVNLSEYTGEPRPIPAVPETPPPPEALATPVETPQIQATLDMPLPPKPIPAPKPRVQKQPTAAVDTGAQENWDRVPRHLQTLFGAPNQEVAQNSYKAFKETREELVQRLLDPTVSLEEAARVLNVCPTTVRRYTNRGVLRHYRTAGNQRRFKLSDVLAFMETGQRGPAPDEAPSS